MLFIVSCDNSEKKIFIAPDNALNLIAGDSIKTWKLAKRFNNGYRMNMGDCFLSYRVTYDRNLKMRDNNGDYFDCGNSLRADWEIVTNDKGSFIRLESDDIPTLLSIDKNYKYFQIVSLSENELAIKFKHTQFSSTPTFITDYLVPEDIEVENRDFHNR